MDTAMAGPLKGIRIIEMGGIGPAPFAAMMLADHGAEVIRVERAGMIGFENDPLRRSRRSISLDVKHPDAVEIVRRLAARADGLIEGYRPGVMERLGLGPDELLRDNSKLVYGRVTGWGQDGPLAQDAGHDINYIALTGLLHGIGPKERPLAPVNYLGDYAGGAMMLAFGMVSALLAVRSGGTGQVVDAAMSDGASLIGAMTYGTAGCRALEERARGEPPRRRLLTPMAFTVVRTASSWRLARSNLSSSRLCSRASRCGLAQAGKRLLR